MKKIVFTAAALCIFCLSTLAQKEKTNLDNNLKTVDELNKMLATKYTQIQTAEKAVPGNSFKMGEIMVLNYYGDEAAQKQADAIEKEFNGMLANSTWKFDKIDPQNGMQKVTVATKTGETQQSNYSTVGATFIANSLIQGMDLNVYIYQNKTNAKNHIIVFALPTGMSCVAEFVKQ